MPFPLSVQLLPSFHSVCQLLQIIIYFRVCVYFHRDTERKNEVQHQRSNRIKFTQRVYLLQNVMFDEGLVVDSTGREIPVRFYYKVG